MKEKLYTIPLNDAINAQAECPFCFIERNVEQDLLDFTLGSSSSYMESDVREATDKAGFCRMHYKKMFDYGNTLGNGWILKSHYIRTIEEMQKQFQSCRHQKTSPWNKRKAGSDTNQNSVASWISEKEESCYICNRFRDTFARYLDTFFYMYLKDETFPDRIRASKGFCLHHFGELCEAAEGKIPDKQKEAFFADMFRLMESNMQRMSEDVNWLVDKFDYLNKDADWKTSRDAIQRGMQKMKGGYPADPVYKMKK